MSRKRPTQNELYWKVQREAQIRQDFEKWLKAEGGLQPTPDNAHRFAIVHGAEYRAEFGERNLILLLVGALPEFYD